MKTFSPSTMACISCSFLIANPNGPVRPGLTCQSCCLDYNVDMFVKSTEGECDICGLRADVMLAVLPICGDCTWIPFINWHVVSAEYQQVITSASKVDRDHVMILGHEVKLDHPEYRSLLRKTLQPKQYAIMPSEVPIMLSHEFTRGDWTDSWWDTSAFLGGKCRLSYNSMFFDMHGVTIDAALGFTHKACPKLPTTILAGLKLLYNEDQDDVSDFMFLHLNKVKDLRYAICHRDASPVGHVSVAAPVTPFWETDFQTEYGPVSDTTELSPDLDNIVEFPELDHADVL